MPDERDSYKPWLKKESFTVEEPHEQLNANYDDDTEYGPYTVDDIDALPESKRAELIDGYIYEMAAPSVEHQLFLMALSFEIRGYIKNRGGSCRVIPAPFAVRLMDDKRNHFEPDISVVCDLSKLSKRGCEGPPEWIIEIVSTSSQSIDYVTKLNAYQTAGVQEYWIVDPLQKRVTVFTYGEPYIVHFYTFDDTVPSATIPGLAIDFPALVRDL